MIQINPLQSYIDGGARAAITTPPSASLVFDLPGRAIWVKGVKLKGTDHTYTFSHDNYISITNTPDQNNLESEDILIGINTTLLKQAIDTTYGIVDATTNGLAPMFSSANKASATAATTYNFLGIVGTTLKWYQLPWRNVRINAETTDVLGVDDTDPLIIGSGNGISVTWDSTDKRIIITNTKPDVNHNTDTHVSQMLATDDAFRPIILKQSANTDNEVGSVRYTSTLLYNPSTKILKINNSQVVTMANIYVGATSSTDATVGLVPAATSAQRNYFLRGDGTWLTIVQENTWRPIKVGNTDALGSGTNTGTLSFAAGTGITLGWDATNKKITITNSAPDLNHNTDRTGIKKDTVSGTKKTDTTLIVANSSSGLIFEGGTNLFKIGDGTNYVEIPVTPSFAIDNKAATIGTSLTTIATIAGTDITAKIGSYAASDHTHPLSIAGDSGTSSITLAASTKYKLTAGGSTYIFTSTPDENVKQTPKTDNVNRPLMMINGSTSAGELTSTSMFSTGIYANASTKMITANGFIKNDYDDTSVLLAGGGAKALSDFAMANLYVKKAGDTMSGPLKLNGSPSQSNPPLQINYTSDFEPDESTIGLLKFGKLTTHDMYLGIAPTTKTHFGRVGYFMHVNTNCEFTWASSNFTNLMALTGGTGNLWVKGDVTAASFTGNATTSSYPLGFSGRQNTNNWPGVTGHTLLTAWQDTTKGGEIAFLTNGSGQVSVAVDGFFYQGIDSRGNHRVVDTYDLASYYTKTESDNRYVNITGDTMTGKLLINSSTATNSLGNLVINDSATPTTYNRIISYYLPNAASGAEPNFYFGVSDAQNNGGYIGFKYYSAGSTTNFVGIGLYNNDNILNIVGTSRVGIGTISPAYKLDVNGTIGAIVNVNSNTYLFHGRNNYSGGGHGLFIEHPNLPANSSHCPITFGKAASTNDRGNLTFYYVGSGSNSNRVGIGFHGNDNKLVVTAGGNVGIGTTAPSNKLHVSGGNGIKIEGDNGGPYLTVNYNSRYDSDNSLDNYGINLIKFGKSAMDNYLGTGLNTGNSGYFGRQSYVFHTGSSYAFGWYSSGWDCLMELQGATGNLWTKGWVYANYLHSRGNLYVQGTSYFGRNSYGDTYYINGPNYNGNANTCYYPYGFTSRGTSDWSGVPGTFATDWSVNGADIMFKYDGSKLNVITDGYFYLGIDIYGASTRVADLRDLAGYVKKTGDTMTGPLLLNASVSQSNPPLLILYNTSFSASDYSIGMLKFGHPTNHDAYLGIAPASRTHFGKEAYFCHITNNKEFDWMSGGWTKLMALECSSANLWVAGSVYAAHFYENSDARLKHDISPISKSVKQFKFYNDERIYYGFIAQELETLHPELVDNSEEYKKVNYNSAICYYIAELENKVQQLEEKIKRLEVNKN